MCHLGSWGERLPRAASAARDPIHPLRPEGGFARHASSHFFRGREVRRH